MRSKMRLFRTIGLLLLVSFVLASCMAPGPLNEARAPAVQAVAQAATTTSPSGADTTATPTPEAAATTAATETPPPEVDVIATPPAEGDVIASVVSPPVASPGGDLPGEIAIQLVKVADGLLDPVNVATPGDGSGRVFVVERPGRIMIVENGNVLKEPFLDIQSKVLSAFLEQGLYDMVFHPNFKENGLFYIHYAELLRNGDSLIVQYKVSADNPNKADPKSAKAILHVEQPYANHNGGELAFGPDGYLYIGIGDGGWEGDPLEAGQDLSTMLGKLLRIDVNAEGEQAYAIPDDNPFSANVESVELFGPSELEFARNHPQAKPEVWAWGLRNPWKFNFDRKTGDLYIADVGQNHYEEINFQPANSGGGENYGWDFLQASHCFPIDEPACPPVGVLPVAEYSHDHGCAVVGIGVYRGQEFPTLDGIYFAGDYCSGHVWGLARTGEAAQTGQWTFQELLDTDLRLTGSGQDENGTLYVTSCECHYGGAGPKENPPGALWRIVPADQVPASAETAPTGGEDKHTHDHGTSEGEGGSAATAGPAASATATAEGSAATATAEGSAATAGPATTATAEGSASPAGGTAAVTVEADSFYFEPKQFTIPAGQPTQVEVFNESDIPHTFTIKELNIDVVLQPDERKTVTVNAQPGQYSFVCTFHPNRMQGTMKVQ